MTRSAGLLCLLLAAGGRVAGASAPPGYVVEHWTVERGLPNNSLTSIIQTRDGYLWIASWAGISRFDGVQFAPVADNLPNDHARAIVEDTDGAMSKAPAVDSIPRVSSIVTAVCGSPPAMASPSSIPPCSRATRWLRLPPSHLDSRGNGLRNLRERMTAVGGTLEVEAGAGAGTRVQLTVPVPPA